MSLLYDPTNLCYLRHIYYFPFQTSLIFLSGRDKKKVDLKLRIGLKFSDELKNKSSPKYQELETKVKKRVSVSF